MTDRRYDEAAGNGQPPGEPVPEPASGAGYGNDAEELQKSDAPKEGEEKSA